MSKWETHVRLVGRGHARKCLVYELGLNSNLTATEKTKQATSN